MISKKDYSSAIVPDSTAAVGNVSESEAEVSSISSNSAVPSEPTHEIIQRQLRTSGLPIVPSQVWYNPAYVQSTPAFLARATGPAPLIQPIDQISTNTMAIDGASSHDSTQFAQVLEAEEEDAFDVAIRELFS